MVMNMIHAIWRWLVSFCGSVFMIFAVVSAIIILIEMILYRVKKRTGTGDASVRTEKSGPRIALVTGASSGLGRQMAMDLDRNEKNIDEIWLTARREDRLKELAGSLKHETRIFPVDLLDEAGFAQLTSEFEKNHVQIGVLINCAGLGKIGNYRVLTVEEENRMIDLNDRAAVDMTIAALPFMKQGDRIIEICSTAAFQPLQHFNVYAASKSFLYNYSRALRMELLPRRIAVTAVCPYWMKDTEFIPVARKTGSSGAAIRHFPFSSTSDRVVGRAMRASRMGFAVSTPGVFCSIHRFFAKLIPRESLLFFWEGLRRV